MRNYRKLSEKLKKTEWETADYSVKNFRKQNKKLQNKLSEKLQKTHEKLNNLSEKLQKTQWKTEEKTKWET